MRHRTIVSGMLVLQHLSMRVQTAAHVQPRVVVVTYAQNEPFESSQDRIIATLNATNSADIIHRWRLDDIMRAYPQHAAVWRYPGANGRPGCCAQKPVLVMDAMRSSREGDWVVWLDSSRYFPDGVHADLRGFVDALDRHGLDAFPGHPACGLRNMDAGLVSGDTYRVMGVDCARYWMSPHLQNNFFALKLTAKKERFVHEWMRWNLDVKLGCSSRVDDQAIFSLLAVKYNMSVLSMCNIASITLDPHPDITKNVDYVITRLLETKDAWRAEPIDDVRVAMHVENKAFAKQHAEMCGGDACVMC